MALCPSPQFSSFQFEQGNIQKWGFAFVMVSRYLLYPPQRAFAVTLFLSPPPRSAQQMVSQKFDITKSAMG